MPFQIIRNDITKVKADAIVNTANPKPVIGGGTDSAVYAAAGEELLLAERRKIGPIAEGQAVETPAFALPAKYIIHTVSPIWKGGNCGELDTLRSCYENSLKTAQRLKCRSIAFPLIASGVNGFPKDKALQSALSVIQPFVMENSMKVILAVFDRDSFELSGNIAENIREYVDANYVEEAHEREYRPLADMSRRISSSVSPAGPNNNGRVSGKVDIDGLIASQGKTFQEKLFEMIDERGLTGPQVYENYVSKQVYSKILSDKNYHPNKYTAIALCLSLHLSLDETKDLIGRAGWALSQSSKADLVVTACIINGEYNPVRIDLLLVGQGCDVLKKIK